MRGLNVGAHLVLRKPATQRRVREPTLDAVALRPSPLEARDVILSRVTHPTALFTPTARCCAGPHFTLRGVAIAQRTADAAQADGRTEGLRADCADGAERTQRTQRTQGAGSGDNRKRRAGFAFSAKNSCVNPID